jgi:hypothetical protein
MRFRATSRIISRRAAFRAAWRSLAAPPSEVSVMYRSSNDQSAMVYAPVIGTFNVASAVPCRNENSSLWYGSRSETGPVTAAFE